MAVRQQVDYDRAPPRPYSWKTDEFQTQAEGRTINLGAQPRTTPLLETPVAPQAGALAYTGPKDLSGNYRCPFCGTHFLPVIERRISTAGWIVFGTLLIFTLFFFWIGLLLKEDVPVCPICKRAVK